MGELAVRRRPWSDWSELAPTWEQIHCVSADASFFLSREWVDCWLACFGEQLNPDLITFASNGDIVGCCLLVRRTEWVAGIPLRRIYLNCAGEDQADSTYIEYNSILSRPGRAEQVAHAFAELLRGSQWDEVLLPGVDEHSPVCAAAASLGGNEISRQPSYYVDLRRLRTDAKAFDSVLSSNTREQIRRSRRLYERANGPCTFRVARTVPEGLEILSRLTDLHQAAWQDKGRAGAFASPRFTAFHRRLIETTFRDNRVMLAELSAGDKVIGALYSFVYRGRVYFYQSGFEYSSDGRLKPGLLTHYMAILHCLEQPGLDEYDFLAGDAQYKRSLTTASRSLHWNAVHRPTVPRLLYRLLRWAKRSYVRLREGRSK